MRNWLFLLAFTLLYSSAYSQKDQALAKNGLPKNAKVILLSSGDDKNRLFESAAKVLFENGYEVKNSDKNTGIIQTDNKNVKGGWYLRMSISVSDSTVRIRGNTYIPRLDNSELVNYGMKGSLNLMAFSEMDRVAKLIPHASISYLP